MNNIWKGVFASLGLVVGIIVEKQWHPGQKITNFACDILCGGSVVREAQIEHLGDQLEDLADLAGDTVVAGALTVETVAKMIKATVSNELDEIQDLKDFIVLLREDYANWSDLREIARNIQENNCIISDADFTNRLAQWEKLNASEENDRERLRARIGEDFDKFLEGYWTKINDAATQSYLRVSEDVNRKLEELNRTAAENPLIMDLQNEIIDINKKLKEMNKILTEIRKSTPVPATATNKGKKEVTT